MAWDENVCANSPAPEFDIPEDTTAKDAILNILGYEEVNITLTEEGKEVTMTILRKKETDTALVCVAKVCGSVVGC